MKQEVRISRRLRELLSQEAPPEFQETSGLAGGLLTNGDLIANEVIKAALMGKEWAILMIRDGTEGKPGQATKDDTTDRTTEEALDDVTRKRLNDLAGGNPGPSTPASPAGDTHSKPEPKDSGVDPDRPRPPERTTGTARGLLDLPRDGDRHSED